MDKAVIALRQLFAVPSADLMQQNPLCGICWSDYEGKDQPVKLPCGHVFGEECVTAWAKGTTPTGCHNGCPTCRAKLLPPSLHSYTSALNYWLSDMPEVWLVFKDFLGGPIGVAFLVGLKTVDFGAGWFRESQIGAYVRRGSSFFLILFLVYRLAKESGWRSRLFTTTVLILVVIFATWIINHLHC